MVKKIVSLFVIMLAVISAAHCSAVLDISIDKYEPYPAEPGAYIDVWLRVENAGQDKATNVMIELEPEFPFSIDDDDVSSTTIGSIPAGNSVIKRYQVRVSDNAVEGENDFNIRYKHNNYDWGTVVETINVQTHDAIIAIKDVTTEAIAPGREGQLNITIENMADSFMKDISVKLNLTGISASPVRGGVEKRIYLLEPKETQEISFNLVALPDSEGGTFKVPTTISYSDSTGTDYSRSEYVTLKIGEKPEIILTISEDTYLERGTSQKIVFDAVNTGLTKAKFLTLTVKDSEDYEFLIPKTYYIGDLDSDDFETADFRIIPDKKGTTTIPIELTYMDVNNKEYSETIDVPVRIYSSYELKSLGITEGSSFGWLIGLLVVAGIGYYYWKTRIKK
mgnify:CR=1 FL=1